MINIKVFLALICVADFNTTAQRGLALIRVAERSKASVFNIIVKIGLAQVRILAGPLINTPIFYKSA